MDILFLSHNRLKFTEASLDALIENTNWSEVTNLYLYDDDSTDGARQCLINHPGYPIKPKFRLGKFGSPVAVMNDYLCSSGDKAHIFAKIDSDTMVPPLWLDECLRIMHLHPGLQLLGIEAFRPVDPNRIEHRGYDEAQFIGGIGLMRASAFRYSLPRPNGRFGFTEWQEANPDVYKAWLNPALPVFLLDWLPREPWLSLTKEYVAQGWNRDWNVLFPDRCPYPEDRKDLWSWWCA